MWLGFNWLKRDAVKGTCGHVMYTKCRDLFGHIITIIIVTGTVICGLTVNYLLGFFGRINGVTASDRLAPNFGVVTKHEF
jgi:hypothetical protein